LYESPTVSISKEDFEKPRTVNTTFDCNKYHEQKQQDNQMFGPGGF